MSLKPLYAAAVAAALIVPAVSPWAQAAPGEIKIGVLNDRSGYQTDWPAKGPWWRPGWRQRISAAA